MKKEGWLDELFAEQTVVLLAAFDRVLQRIYEMEKRSEARNLFYLGLIEKHKRMKQ
ncbi:MAG: hypothetical protein HY007_03760 [Candidatus Sungbacteria bacterium]|nr:hypothetical protein [Candidatus Sungbacteria bacterium]